MTGGDEVRRGPAPSNRGKGIMTAPTLEQLNMDPEQPISDQGDGALLADFPGGGAQAKIDARYLLGTGGFTPPADSCQRLQKIKASYDPGQAIISAHPIWSAQES
jgi:hypothetical protein